MTKMTAASVLRALGRRRLRNEPLLPLVCPFIKGSSKAEELLTKSAKLINSLLMQISDSASDLDSDTTLEIVRDHLIEYGISEEKTNLFMQGLVDYSNSSNDNTCDMIAFIKNVFPETIIGNEKGCLSLHQFFENLLSQIA